MQPITVRYIEVDDIYQIMAGERRYRAAQAAGLIEIPCCVKTPKAEEVLVHQIVENWQRAQLHPFEIADALAQLRDANDWSQKQLADEIGKPEAEISKLLKLLELEPSVQTEARDDATGALSFRHLYNIARLASTDQAAIATAVRQQGLSAGDCPLFCAVRGAKTGTVPFSQAVLKLQLVKREIDHHKGIVKRGSPVTRVEYVTAQAKVVLIFRRQSGHLEHHPT